MAKEQSKGATKRVVYISGCWDLFHIGHLWALEQARDMGDFLVVGVNTDELIRSYKNGPVIPYEQRVDIISAIEFVDAVVPHSSFLDTTGFEKYGVNIRAIGPDFGKYEGQRRSLEKKLPGGARLIQFSWYSGEEVSTTMIKEKVRCLTGQKQ